MVTAAVLVMPGVSADSEYQEGQGGVPGPGPGPHPPSPFEPHDEDWEPGDPGRGNDPFNPIFEPGEGENARFEPEVIDRMQDAADIDDLESITITTENGTIQIYSALILMFDNQVYLDAYINDITDVAADYLDAGVYDRIQGNRVFDIVVGDMEYLWDSKICVTLPYTLEEGKDPSELRVLSPYGDSVREITCSYDEDAHTVTFWTNHLSFYIPVWEQHDHVLELGVIVGAVIAVAAACGIALYVHGNRRGRA